MASNIFPVLNPVRLLVLSLCAVCSLCSYGCAGAARGPDASGPRVNEPPYPVLLTDDPNRREAALAAWTTLTRQENAGVRSAPAPLLQPVTATLRDLSTAAMTPLYLPKVGTGATMTEDETRESLRRFIATNSRLLGADPSQLSLELRTDEADGTKKARYQQEPFRRPLRGGYGVLEISFTTDRRIRQLNSTCIPDAARLQQALTNARTLLTPRVPLTSDEIARRLSGRTLPYTDAAGNAQTLTVASADEINVHELVIYPRPRASEPPVLEIHVAWEITLGAAPAARTIYLDIVTDELLGVS